MDEQQFWKIIDDAWASDNNLTHFRDTVLTTLESESSKNAFEEKYSNGDPCIPSENIFMSALESSLGSLSRDSL